MKINIVILLSLFSLCSQSSLSQQHVELGTVEWQRDLDQALVYSRAEKKPIFILFQEVPGCLNCRNYGEQVLSHPLIDEAIETLFIPVAIFNNKKGKDAEALIFFHEPSWNNPVVRIVDEHKRDIIGRVNGNYSKAGIVIAMINAFKELNRTVPQYLEILAEEFGAETKAETAYLSMYCFWKGEKEIGKLDGVVETEAGFMDGKEVVRVMYNPETIPLNNLLTQADAASCAQSVYTTSKNQNEKVAEVIGKNRAKSATQFHSDREPKYYLGHSLYRFIPMTETQAARVNSMIGQKKNPDELLSSRQLKLLDYISKNQDIKFENMINKSIQSAWPQIEKYLE